MLRIHATTRITSRTSWQVKEIRNKEPCIVGYDLCENFRKGKAVGQIHGCPGPEVGADTGHKQEQGKRWLSGTILGDSCVVE